MATLADYLQRTQRLLADVTVEIFNIYDLVEYINEGRFQLAGQSGIVRARGTMSTVATQAVYNHSAITLPGASGFGPVQFIERMWYVDPNPANQEVPLDGRRWGWFSLYFVTIQPAAAAIPTTWSQYSQGTTGTFYIGPAPTGIANLAMDCVAQPIKLGVNTVATDVDAIQYPFSDSVPYYAASLALKSKRQYDDATTYMQQFDEYIRMAVAGVTPTPMPQNFERRLPSSGQPQAARPPGPSPALVA